MSPTQRPLRFSACIVLAALAAPLAAQTQGPIRLVFDMHSDPIPNGLSLPGRVAVYQEWVGNMSWVLDRSEPLGGQV
jgi:hypothetical protein